MEINIEDYDKEYFIKVAKCTIHEFFKRYEGDTLKRDMLLFESVVTLRQLCTTNTVALQLTNNSYLALTSEGVTCFLYDATNKMVSFEGHVIYARILPLALRTARSMITHVVFDRGYKMVSAGEMLKNLNR